MVKRVDLEKRIARIAKAKGEPVVYREGGSHTVVQIGDRQTTIPCHREVNENTARAIINYLEGPHGN